MTDTAGQLAENIRKSQPAKKDLSARGARKKKAYLLGTTPRIRYLSSTLGTTTISQQRSCTRGNSRIPGNSQEDGYFSRIHTSSSNATTLQLQLHQPAAAKPENWHSAADLAPQGTSTTHTHRLAGFSRLQAFTQHTHSDSLTLRLRDQRRRLKSTKENMTTAQYSSTMPATEGCQAARAGRHSPLSPSSSSSAGGRSGAAAASMEAAGRQHHDHPAPAVPSRLGPRIWIARGEKVPGGRHSWRAEKLQRRTPWPPSCFILRWGGGCRRGVHWLGWGEKSPDKHCRFDCVPWVCVKFILKAPKSRQPSKLASSPRGRTYVRAALENQFLHCW